MSAFEALVQELDQEARSTRRLLERVPAAQLGWRPHPRSMTLGQLALHVAGTPGDLTDMAGVDVFDATSVSFDPRQPESVEEILAVFESGREKCSAYLSKLTPEAGAALWALVLGGQNTLSMPRAELLRSLLFNHWYHHRGQLTVYLRCLDVPLPSVYGPTADENPFRM